MCLCREVGEKKLKEIGDNSPQIGDPGGLVTPAGIVGGLSGERKEHREKEGISPVFFEKNPLFNTGRDVGSGQSLQTVLHVRIAALCT